MSTLSDSNIFSSLLFNFFPFIRGPRLLLYYPGRNSFGQRWHRALWLYSSLLLLYTVVVVVVVVVRDSMRRVRSDWLQPFPRSSASFGPAAFNMWFTGFCGTCFSSRLRGVMRVGVGLVSRCQAGHTAMSLPTLNKQF